MPGELRPPLKSADGSGSSAQHIVQIKNEAAAAKSKRKAESEVGGAERLGCEGQFIVMRQWSVVLALAKDHHNIKQAEQLLASFEATLNDLRSDDSGAFDYKGYSIRVLNWNGRYYAFIQREGTSGAEVGADAEPQWYESPEEAIAALKTWLDVEGRRD